jgi:putative peptidoglycan lipid II flippase
MRRVQAAIAKANQKIPIQLAAILLAGSTLLSALLGILRERFLNRAYYDTYPTGIDAYTVAFTLPDFMFIILVSGALSVTFIPVFNERLAKGNKRSAWELSTSLINFMALITLAASILIIIFAEPIVQYIVAPGLDEASRALAVSMMRVIAVNPFLFAIATVIASMQQAIGRFTFFALAPTIYNVGIIIGTLFFTQGISIFGWEVFEGGIMGVALGVVLGSILQLLVSTIGLFGLGFDYRFKIYWKNKGFKKVLSLLPARSLDQGMDYVVSIAETNLASRMASGTIRAYNQALTLHLMPINLIGVAISTAAFPSLTERLGEGRVDLFTKELRGTIRVITWIILPVATIAFFARGYVVNFIKEGGDPLMANLLGALVVAILFRSIYHIAARSFYAQQDTKTPLYVSIFAIALNVVLAIWFTTVLDWGPYGLAWAQSIVAMVEVILLFAIMSRQLPDLFDAQFMHAVGRMLGATALMGVISYILVQLFQLQEVDQKFLETFPKFVVIVIVSLGAYVWFSRLFKLSEVNPVIKRVQSLLFGRAK